MPGSPKGKSRAELPAESPTKRSTKDLASSSAPGPAESTASPLTDVAPQPEGTRVELGKLTPCAYCGHFIDVAFVVRLENGRYDYLCEGCAVRTKPHK